MIEGLTHNDGVLNKIVKYRGKISAGYAAGEGPNKGNHPVAAGFFRILREIVKNEKVGSKTVTSKQWVTNEEIQKVLAASHGNNPAAPRRIEIVCLYKTPEEMWESSLSMYSSTEGLLCKSFGKGTVPRYLTYDNTGERKWIDRKFDGKEGCPHEDCPDFKEGKCKAIGLLKCFPTVDLTVNPYRFETRSINAIVGIESSFNDMWSLLQAAHTVKQLEASKPLPFDGFFGMKLYLTHRKIKSGGRDVYITDLLPTPDFNTLVMEPIKRGIFRNVNSAKIAGGAGGISLLSAAAGALLQAPIDAEAVPLDLPDQRDIAVNFGADADEVSVEGVTIDDEKSAVDVLTEASVDKK